MEEKLRQQPLNIIRIALFGPESTGKTTLSKQLAHHYDTVWVREYAREYLQEKWNNERKTCELGDIMPIAYGQIALENKVAQRADKVLICDTDLLETMVYSEQFYNGYADDALREAADENSYDLYLLTYIDTPWEKDDLRDRPDQRLEMFRAFEKALQDFKKPYLLLKGNKQERLRNAIHAIDELIAKGENLYSYSQNLRE